MLQYYFTFQLPKAHHLDHTSKPSLNLPKFDFYIGHLSRYPINYPPELTFFHVTL
jgi:hypothetical protein